MSKRLISAIACAVLTLNVCTSLKANALANGWAQVDNKWCYFENSSKKTGWINNNNKWFYLNNAGYMVTGWLNYNGNWYYLNNDGYMVTGWLNYNGNWYYLNNDGSMATNISIDDWFIGNDGIAHQNQVNDVISSINCLGIDYYSLIHGGFLPKNHELITLQPEVLTIKESNGTYIDYFLNSNSKGLFVSQVTLTLTTENKNQAVEYALNSIKSRHTVNHVSYDGDFKVWIDCNDFVAKVSITQIGKYEIVLFSKVSQ